MTQLLRLPLGYLYIAQSRFPQSLYLGIWKYTTDFNATSFISEHIERFVCIINECLSGYCFYVMMARAKQGWVASIYLILFIIPLYLLF